MKAQAPGLISTDRPLIGTNRPRRDGDGHCDADGGDGRAVSRDDERSERNADRNAQLRDGSRDVVMIDSVEQNILEILFDTTTGKMSMVGDVLIKVDSEVDTMLTSANLSRSYFRSAPMLNASNKH